MKKAAFLDRDGVINRKAPEGQYVTRWEEMEFLPRVAEAIASLNSAGFSVIVVSNQRCVAKGLATGAELDVLHQKMLRTLDAAGAHIDDVYYCPHDDTPPCECRKPAPGLLLAAAAKHCIDLTQSWMIGDSDVDVRAALTAGCKTVRIVRSGEQMGAPAVLVARSLLDAVQQIQMHEASPPNNA